MSSNGLEHKDERLHATEGVDWRDKLAELRGELSTGDPDDTGEDVAEGDE